MSGKTFFMSSNLGCCFVSLIFALPKLMLGWMGASLTSSRYKRFHSDMVSTVTSPVCLITAHLAGTGGEEGRSLFGSQALGFSGSPDWASLSFSYQGNPCVFSLPSWALLGASPGTYPQPLKWGHFTPASVSPTEGQVILHFRSTLQVN